MKRWGCLEESERLLIDTVPETTNPHLHWGHQHNDAVRERAALAPVTGSKDSRAAGPGWQRKGSLWEHQGQAPPEASGPQSSPSEEMLGL